MAVHRSDKGGGGGDGCQTVARALKIKARLEEAHRLGSQGNFLISSMLATRSARRGLIEEAAQAFRDAAEMLEQR